MLETQLAETIHLSADAVATLRIRIKLNGKDRVREIDLEGFRELVAAGIMEEVPGSNSLPDFRFTEDGLKRREEILAAGEAYLRSLEPRLPNRIELSDAARNLLSRRLEGDESVTDRNRPAYRELAAAGIMVPVSTFAGGPEARYQFTWQGWERRHEFQRTLPRRSASAIARSLSLAVSRIFKGVSPAR